jgi:hypothetical protein
MQASTRKGAHRYKHEEAALPGHLSRLRGVKAMDLRLSENP